jgi:hypothetical protein
MIGLYTHGKEQIQNQFKTMQQKESKTNTHFIISMIKSVIRLGACVLLGYSLTQQAAFTFALAEVLGIFEEL